MGLLATIGISRLRFSGFVIGASMANFTSLAAARHSVLQKAGWDVKANGLFGALNLNEYIIFKLYYWGK